MAMPNENLRCIIARIQALECGIEALRLQIAEQYRLARYYQFDTRAIKAAIRTRADPSGAVEHLALIERCFEALGQAKRGPPAGGRAPAMFVPGGDPLSAVAEKAQNEPNSNCRTATMRIFHSERFAAHDQPERDHARDRRAN
jgi:uncharacterized protein (UPF0335 family)